MLVVVGMLALIVLITWVNGAERRIPVQYAKRQVGRKMYGGQASVRLSAASILLSKYNSFIIDIHHETKSSDIYINACLLYTSRFV